MKNGDRLTGTIISENTNQVVIATSWAKELPIAVAEISKREIVPVTTASTPAPVSSDATVKTSTPTNAPSATPAPVRKSPAVVAKKPTPTAPKKKNWQGDIRIGADLGFSEKNRQLYTGGFKATYAPGQGVGINADTTPIERFKTTFDFNAAYGTTEREVRLRGGGTETEKVVSANRMDGSIKTDFDIGKKVFVYNLFGAGRDEIRKIDLRYEFGPGVGYHILKSTNYTLNAEVGINYQVYQYQNTETDRRYFYRLAEDFSWRISKKFTFDEKLEFFPQVDDFGSYRIRFESNLRYWLMDNLTFNLTVLDTYDTKPANTVQKNDLQIRSSIGLNF